jgi:hypothetical protein
MKENKPDNGIQYGAFSKRTTRKANHVRVRMLDHKESRHHIRRLWIESAVNESDKLSMPRISRYVLRAELEFLNAAREIGIADGLKRDGGR